MENRKPMRSPMIPKLLFPKAANIGKGQVFWLVPVCGVFPITNISDVGASNPDGTYSYGHSPRITRGSLLILGKNPNPRQKYVIFPYKRTIAYNKTVSVAFSRRYSAQI